MADLTDLSSVEGEELSEKQIKGILAEIDLDIVNLVRDGKLCALKYGLGGPGGQSTDRASNLKALLDARKHYEAMLKLFASWEVSEFSDGDPA